MSTSLIPSFTPSLFTERVAVHLQRVYLDSNPLGKLCWKYCTDNTRSGTRSVSAIEKGKRGT